MLYLFLTLSDLLVGVSAAGVSYVLIRTQLRAGLENTFTGLSPSLFVKMYSFLYFVSCRASVFITCTMCITQTIQVRAVFYQPRYSAILASVLSYIVVWTIVALSYYTLNILVWKEAYLLSIPDIRHELLNKVLFHGVPFALPTLPVLICGVLTCSILIQSRSFRKRNKSTITVVIITITFLIFNLAFLAHYYFHEWILGGEPHDETALRKDEIFFYTSHTLSHFVNSALNPIILIARNERFQTQLTHSVKSSLQPSKLPQQPLQPPSKEYLAMCRLSISGTTCRLDDNTFRIKSPSFLDTVSRCSIIRDVPTVLE
ncbi:hypothetical protein ACHWQZ_G013074 [Mnemiopsis leidyi]